MSKVIKDASAFVPQKIIAHEEHPPVWQDLAKRVEEKQVTAETTLPSKTASTSKLITQPEQNNGVSVEPHKFDADFSAPVVNTGTIEPHSTEIDAAEPVQQNQIDIDAIQEESFNSGLQAGLERAESDYGSSTKALQSIFEQLNTIRETILSNSMEEMRDLVLQIATKIIRHSVSEQELTVIQTIEESIQQAVKSDEFVISVNPDDYATINTRSGDFINSLSGLENIIVKADSTIEQGGCLIESSNCTVDATIASQLELITEKLKKK